MLVHWVQLTTCASYGWPCQRLCIGAIWFRNGCALVHQMDAACVVCVVVSLNGRLQHINISRVG
jgi:hypothetical protein